MSKKLLNEAQVRRFMGLAGIEPTIVSNKVNEWYSEVNEAEEQEDKEEMAEEGMKAYQKDEEEPMKEEEDMGDMPPMDDAPEAPEADAVDAEALAMELIDAMAPVFQKHGVDLSASEGDDAPEMDMDAAAPEGGEELEMADEEDPMDEGGMSYQKDEEDKMEEGGMSYQKDEEDKDLEEVNVQLNQEEIVSEVAKRVINRIRTAKAAKRKYDRALGKK